MEEVEALPMRFNYHANTFGPDGFNIMHISFWHILYYRMQKFQKAWSTQGRVPEEGDRDALWYCWRCPSDLVRLPNYSQRTRH